MSKTKKILLVLFILILILIVAGVVSKKLKGEFIQVQTEKVERMDLIQAVSASGKIQPVTEVDISAWVSGEIVELGVKEGDPVQKDDFLVRLDQTQYKAAEQQAMAAVRSAEANANLAYANLEQAEKKRTRTKKLLAKKLVSDEQFEIIDTQYKVSKASYQAARESVTTAKATLEQAQDQLSKTLLISPMEGTVSRLEKEVGEIAVGSTFTKDVIMVVADLSSMEVIAEVDENDIPDIEVNFKARIEVDALPDEDYHGIVKDISRSANVSAFGTQEETTNFDVKVSVEGDITKLRPGMSATVEIQTASREQVLALPIQCITMRDPEKTGEEARNLDRVNEEDLKDVVFRMEETTAKMVPVTTGISSDTHIEVEGEIKEGDTIISGPYKTLNKELFDGDQIKENEGNEPGKEGQEKS